MYTSEQFRRACQSHFCRGRPCLGILQQEGEGEDALGNYVLFQTPVPRKISKVCRKWLGEGVGPEVISCPECLELDGNIKISDIVSNPTLCADFTDVKQEEEDDTNYFAGDDTKSCDAKEYLLDGDFVDDVDLLSNASSGICTSMEDSEFKPENAEFNPDLEMAEQSSFKCPWCPEVFGGTPESTERFDSHKKLVHHWGLFWCIQCRFKADFPRDLADHFAAEGHSPGWW